MAVAEQSGGEPIQRLIADLGRFDDLGDGLYHFHGFANVSFAAGRGAVLAVDTSSRLFGAQALAALRGVSDEPVSHIVYTHGHADHAFGTQAFLDEAKERGHARPAIWANAALPARLDRYRRTQGWQQHINRIQFSLQTADAFSTEDAAPPDHVVENEAVLDLAGERVELYTAQAETDDALWVYLPERKAALIGDLCITSLPNTGNPNKVQRYTLGWAEALERIAAKQPSLLLPGHGPALRGDLAVEVPTETARALRFLHDAVVDRMNAGRWPWEIVEEGIDLPNDLRNHPYLRPLYGSPHFIVQDVLRYYGGWWNGVAAELFPAPRRERAADLLAVAGRDALLAKGQALLAEDAPARAAHIATVLTDADPADGTAQRLLSDALAARAKRESSYIGRNFLTNAAKRAAEVAE